MTGKEYVIEGIVIHPDHVCGTVPDTPYILVRSESFDLDIFAGCFMKAELILDEERLEQAMDLLKQIARDRQVILFTCRQ